MRELKQNERGMVAIMVSLLVMVILTLLTIGFARVMTREKRQAVDRQLSTQAFYAAESAINKVIAGGITGITTPTTICDTAGTQYQLSADGLVKATCVLLNPIPTEIVVQDVGQRDSRVFPVRTASGSAISSMRFRWSGGTSVATAAAGSFTSDASWGNAVGVLRVHIAAIYNGGSLGSGVAQRTVFLQPVTVGGRSAEDIGSPAADADIIPITCTIDDGVGTCNAELTGLDVMAPGAAYFILRVQSLYTESDVSICANTCSEGLQGVQVVIDATGQANDVFRRVQVRVPYMPGYPTPEYAVETAGNLCKQLKINTNTNANDDTCADPSDYQY
jgi:type II secretory pathway pseudopilin PulG